MADENLIAKARLARRITTHAFDCEINRLLDSAYLDMHVAGVEIPEQVTPLVETAAITYVAMHFGSPDEYERLKKSYDEQKAQLSTCTGYTNWGEVDG